jgi:diguanylate cyclase (GGDEF)-like protein
VTRCRPPPRSPTRSDARWPNSRRPAPEPPPGIARLEDFVAEADFDAQLRRALEYVDTEPEVLDVIVEAATNVAPDNSVELLLADSSQAHLEQVAIAGPAEGGPGCPVQLPFSCPAVRNGRPTIYPDSRHLGACPKLKDRPEGPLAAACVPVTFMGRALGVVHLTGPTTSPPTHQLLDRLTTLATEVGNRIGTVRAFERTHVQASTDSLTGLLNRRALEAAVRDLRRAGHHYAVILADLDHFKILNDTYGHEAGDRALRLFARVIRDTTRPGDLISRYGGEEFVIALPHCTAEHAHDLAHRIQAALATAMATATVPPFTFSAGVADSAMGTDLTAALRHADTALYQAKDNGRNQIHTATRTDTNDDGPARDTSATTPAATDRSRPSIASAAPRQSPPAQHGPHSETLTRTPQPAPEGMFTTMNQPEPMIDT